MVGDRSQPFTHLEYTHAARGSVPGLVQWMTSGCQALERGHGFRHGQRCQSQLDSCDRRMEP